jgi:hypothetical protein
MTFRMHRKRKTRTPANSLVITTVCWLGREDSNLRMAESKSAALPLGYAPLRDARTIATPHAPFNTRQFSRRGTRDRFLI